MDQGHQKKEGYKYMENTIINHNWKDLIKPSKLNIQNSADKSITLLRALPISL